MVMAGARRRWRPSTLRHNLAGDWPLDEYSGARQDHSGNGEHLADTNTVTQAAGPGSGFAAQFVAVNAERLVRADTPGLSCGDINFTLVAGLYLDSKTAEMYAVSKIGTAGGRDYAIIYNNTADRFRLYIGSAFTSVQADNFGAVSTGAWHWLCAWHDADANTINICVNNGAVDSVATAGAVPEDGASAFCIGSYDDGIVGVYWDGRIARGRLWKNRILSAHDRATLYAAFLAGLPVLP